MKNKNISKKLLKIAAPFMASIVLFSPIEACTRALFIGDDETVITGRSMDWGEDMHSDLWIFPREMERNGAAGPQSIKWTSKYGSLITSGYNVGTADGMNEKGFVANVLYLAESDYGQPSGETPLLSIALWAQYALDNFATVTECVEAFRKEPFIVLAPVLPNGSPAQLHLSISDPLGDSAIFEYIGGKLIIHQGKQYQVMTNSPIFERQLALNAYWEGVGYLKFLPGTNRAADRFARASFLIGAIPKKSDPRYLSAVPQNSFINQAISSVMGVIRSVSVPLGISTPGEPNIASTLWRTIADQKNKLYYFDSATSPSTFWIPLEELDFKAGAPVKKLVASGGKMYSGNAVKYFENAKPFTFLSAAKEADPSAK